MEPTSHIAMAMMSAAKATGWAWKLPPEMAASSSGNRIGLSVTAPASILSVRAALASRSSARAHHLRLAAEAVGVLHPAAGTWLVRISLPSSRPAMARRRRSGRAGREARRCGDRTAWPSPSAHRPTSRPPRWRRRTRARRGTARRAPAPSSLRAVDQREPFLRPELKGLEAEPLQAPRPREGRLPADVDLAIAHQRRNQVRERGKVAAIAPTLPCDGMTGMASRSRAPAARRSPRSNA